MTGETTQGETTQGDTTQGEAAEEYVVALLSGAALVVEPGQDGPRLPRLVTRGWPDPVDRQLGDPTAVQVAPLRLAPGPEGTDRWIYPMSGRQPPGKHLLALPQWDTLAEDAELIAGVREALGPHLGLQEWPPARPAWYRPQWYAEIDAWVEQVLAEHGRRPTGARQVIRVWSLSAVVSYATEQGAVFVKATCDWFRAEPVLTQVVASFAAELAPTLLGVETDRAWMLMEALPGDTSEEREVTGSQLCDTARALAGLHQRSTDHLPALVAAGFPDRGAAATEAGLRSVLLPGDGLSDLSDAERAQLPELTTWLGAKVRELFGVGLPVGLAHGDLHLGNVAFGPDGPVFYDWTDACLTHPLLDAVHLVRGAARQLGEDSARAAWTAYLDHWRASGWVLTLDDPQLRALAAVVDDAFQLQTYEGILRAQEASSVGEHAGEQERIVRRLLAARAESTLP